MKATHKDAEQRYEAFRDLSRQNIQQSLPYTDRNLIRLEPISNESLVAAKLWMADPTRRVDWDWAGSGGYSDYAFRYPKRFEMATWYGNSLASLCLGRPSYTGTQMRMDFTEAAPSNNPLKGRVIPIVVSAGELYASIIGAREIRLIDPIHEKLIEYYASIGYTYVNQNVDKHYLVKVLT